MQQWLERSPRIKKDLGLNPMSVGIQASSHSPKTLG